MRRVRGWVALGAGAALALPLGLVAASASAVPGVRAALPVPVVAQPRLGFVEESDRLRSVSLTGTGGPGVAWDADHTARYDLLTSGNRHDGDASARLVTRLETQLVTWVSTAGRVDPPPTDVGTAALRADGPPTAALAVGAAATPDEPPLPGGPGEVYVRATYPFDEEPPELLTDQPLTCDGAHKSHPVVSPDGSMVAFATDARDEWDIAVARVPDDDEPCDPDALLYVTGEGTATGPGTLDTWPTWLDESTLVYSGAREGERPDLFAVDLKGTPVARLTDTPDVSETQPSARALDGSWELVLTTTEFRPDGSLALLAVSPGDSGLTATAEYPYAGDVPRQGSEGTWSPRSPDSRRPDLLPPVAFTSTDGDPAGDVWVTQWSRDEGGRISEVAATQVAGDPDVADSHPAWGDDDPGNADFAPWAQLVYTSEVASTDVSDVVADDGTDLRAIEAHGATYLSSWWPGDQAEAGVDYSPDGTQVAYSVPTPNPDASPGPTPTGPPPAVGESPTVGVHLAVADAATLDLVDLPYEYGADDIDLDPTWSPDGRTIAFVRQESLGEGWAPPELYLLDVETLAVTPLTSADERTWAVDPSWSPDGSRLVYATGYAGDTGSYLAVVDVATRTAARLHVVLTGCDLYGGACPYEVQGRSPDWSPDGTQIAAADLVVLPYCDEMRVGLPCPITDPRALEARGAIGVARLASPDGVPEVVSARALTGVGPAGAPTPTVTQVADADDPEWSPDGTRIAFSAVPVGQPNALRGIVEVAAADGSDPRVVTDEPGPQREPAYQPWADLVLTLTSSAVSPAGDATLTALVRNDGPGQAAEPVVGLTLPPGLTTPGAPGCTVAGQEVTCTLSDPLDRDAAVEIELPVQGVGDTPQDVTAVTATVSPERAVTDNTATVTVVRPADEGTAGGVEVSVTLSAPVAWVGGLPVTETITVRNAGTLPVEGVTLTATYPGTVTPTGLAPCPSEAGPCDLGTLAGADERVYTVTLTPTGEPFAGPPQVGDAHATVTTTSPDPDPANNDVGATLEVRSPKVELRPGVARPGEVVFAVGTDFPPGDVRLAWSTGVMSVQHPVAVQPDGGWRLAVPIIRDTLVTDRNLLASSTLTPQTFGPVRAPLLIVPTSVDAPSFLFRK